MSHRSPPQSGWRRSSFVVGTVIAFARLRTSPWYPRFNDVNSDLYVFQMIGNSWLYGFLPYRDVYDVKGPFLHLLFGLFAWIRPWSMGPPLVFLAILASCSMWLAHRIGRLYRLSRGIAALCAAASCVVIYLGVADVKTSFTCEEIAGSRGLVDAVAGAPPAPLRKDP